ncbi:MAG TPA: ATP-binding protein [Candidatus Obscuribacterales bacterium]
MAFLTAWPAPVQAESDCRQLWISIAPRAGARMMRAKLNLPQKGLILVGTVLVFELVFVGVLTVLLQQAEAEIKREVRATLVMSSANGLITLFHDSASSLVGYALTRNSEMIERYDQSVAEFSVTLSKLNNLVKDNPKEARLLKDVQVIVNQGIDLLNRHKERLLTGGRIEALRRFRADRAEVREILETFAEKVKLLAAEEKKILEENPEAKAAARRRVQQFIYLGIAMNVVFALSLALFFMQGIVRRLGTLNDNTVRLARGEPLNPQLAGNDEIANLDRVFHEMAAALKESTEKERAMTESARASEARVRSIIDSMPVGLVIASTDGVIESANPRMLLILGCPEADLVGRNLVEFFPAPEFSSFTELVSRHAERAVGGVVELQARRLDGKILPAELQLEDFSTQDGPRVLAIVQDVTERHEVEKLKKEFVAMVSHELRTPLTSIRGSLGLLAAGKLGQLPDKALRAVTIAERNTVRLTSLINDILDLEKLEAGKMEMHFQDVLLKTVIDRSIESVKVFAEQSEIALQVQPDGISRAIQADPDRLVQVLVNLLSNAVKFSPRGSAVTISVEESPGWATVVVLDRGRGIPEAFKERVFERFQQVEQSDAKKKGGSGLGLAICKAIVEQHGGQIGVDSEEGKGSRFWFRLPVGPTDVVTSAIAGV